MRGRGDKRGRKGKTERGRRVDKDRGIEIEKNKRHRDRVRMREGE